MSEILPQEVEVRYIIPAIRGTIAKIMVKELEMSQKTAADILGLTQAAISQYLHDKRGTEVEFSPAVLKEIKSSAKKIRDSKEPQKLVLQELYTLSKLTSIKKVMCDLHRKSSKELKDCTICFEGDDVALKI